MSCRFSGCWFADLENRFCSVRLADASLVVNSVGYAMLQRSNPQ